MKKLFFLSLILIYTHTGFSQISIGNVSSTPDPSAMLEVKPSLTSNAKGFRLPNLNASQISGITSPATGLLVADLSSNTMQYRNSSEWLKVPAFSSVSSSAIAFSHVGTVSVPLLTMTNFGTGSAISGSNVSTSPFSVGLYGSIGNSSGGANSSGVVGVNITTGVNGSGVWGNHLGTGIGVLGKSNGGIGVSGQSLGANSIGVSGQSSGATSLGVSGTTDDGKAVYGNATNSAGRGGYFVNSSGTGGIGVAGYATSPASIGVSGTTDDGKAVYGNATNLGYAGYFEAAGLAQALYTSGSVQFQNNGEANGRVLTSDALGGASWQDLPKIAFMAINTSSNYTVPSSTTQVAIFDGTDFNIGNNFSTVTNKFTAPKSGIYHFDSRIYAYGTGQFYQQISIYNTSNVLQKSYRNTINPSSTSPGAYSYFEYQLSIDAKMNSTDYAVVEIQTQIGLTVYVTAGTGRFTTFSGHYVCGL